LSKVTNDFFTMQVHSVCQCKDAPYGCARFAGGGYDCDICNVCSECGFYSAHGCACEEPPELAAWSREGRNVVTRFETATFDRSDVIVSHLMEMLIDEGVDYVEEHHTMPVDAIPNYALMRTFTCVVCAPYHARRYHTIAYDQWEAHILSSEHLGHMDRPGFLCKIR
jgi:hypothetical protein